MAFEQKVSTSPIDKGIDDIVRFKFMMSVIMLLTKSSSWRKHLLLYPQQ